MCMGVLSECMYECHIDQKRAYGPGYWSYGWF